LEAAIYWLWYFTRRTAPRLFERQFLATLFLRRGLLFAGLRLCLAPLFCGGGCFCPAGSCCCLRSVPEAAALAELLPFPLFRDCLSCLIRSAPVSFQLWACSLSLNLLLFIALPFSDFDAPCLLPSAQLLFFLVRSFLLP
jgi:hypothetical protein